MSEHEHPDDALEVETALDPESRRSGRNKGAIILAVAAIFLALVLVKVLAEGTAPTGPSAGDPASGTTITSARNDAMADYERAQQSGRPVYVLFHSLT